MTNCHSLEHQLLRAEETLCEMSQTVKGKQGTNNTRGTTCGKPDQNALQAEFTKPSNHPKRTRFTVPVQRVKTRETGRHVSTVELGTFSVVNHVNVSLM